LQYVLNGLPIGAVYALVGLSYSLIYACAGVLNWSQGEMVMLGSYVAFTLNRMVGVSYIPSVLIAMATAACMGVLVQKGVLRSLRIRKAPPINIVIGTLAVAIIIRNLALLIWGPDVQLFPSPVGSKPIDLGGLRLLPQDILIVVTGICLMLLLQYMLRYTKSGKALRAVAQDRMAASLMGVDVERSDALAFATSAALGGAAGILIAPLFFTSFSMGAGIGLKGFISAVVGGLGNVPGAIAGGFFLGLTESIVSGKISSGYRDAISFVVLILVLWLKPTGLFSRTTKPKV
jgi:branched-chain amino acid transport system permease protein